jgi:hypothetical protein
MGSWIEDFEVVRVRMEMEAMLSHRESFGFLVNQTNRYCTNVATSLFNIK